MKRVIGIIIVAICMYSIYFDLKVGTLPKADQHTEVSTSIKYEEILVERGDTLLTIIERNGSFPHGVTIEQMRKDFYQLNDGLYPEQMQPGKMYKIPVYEGKHAQ